MMQGRVWNRAMDINLLNTYGNQLLTGYEMGLTDYYPMNEGKGDYATDGAQGAHLKLTVQMGTATRHVAEARHERAEGDQGPAAEDRVHSIVPRAGLHADVLVQDRRNGRGTLL